MDGSDISGLEQSERSKCIINVLHSAPPCGEGPTTASWGEWEQPERPQPRAARVFGSQDVCASSGPRGVNVAFSLSLAPFRRHQWQAKAADVKRHDLLGGLPCFDSVGKSARVQSLEALLRALPQTFLLHDFILFLCYVPLITSLQCCAVDVGTIDFASHYCSQHLLDACFLMPHLGDLGGEVGAPTARGADTGVWTAQLKPRLKCVLDWPWPLWLISSAYLHIKH